MIIILVVSLKILYNTCPLYIPTLSATYLTPTDSGQINHNIFPRDQRRPFPVFFSIDYSAKRQCNSGRRPQKIHSPRKSYYMGALFHSTAVASRSIFCNLKKRQRESARRGAGRRGERKPLHQSEFQARIRFTASGPRRGRFWFLT